MDENPYKSPQGDGERRRRQLISDRTLSTALHLAAVAVIVVYIVLVVYYIIPGFQ